MGKTCPYCDGELEETGNKWSPYKCTDCGFRTCAPAEASEGAA